MRSAAVALLLASSASHACDGLEARAAWIRELPPGADMTAGYVQLANHGKKVVRIDGASSPAFASTMIHRTKLDHGAYTMSAEPVLVLAPGASLALEPGGRHLMLMQPAKALHAGDRVPVLFNCGQQHIEVEFNVRAEPQ